MPASGDQAAEAQLTQRGVPAAQEHPEGHAEHREVVRPHVGGEGLAALLGEHGERDRHDRPMEPEHHQEQESHGVERPGDHRAPRVQRDHGICQPVADERADRTEEQHGGRDQDGQAHGGHEHQVQVLGQQAAQPALQPGQPHRGQDRREHAGAVVHDGHGDPEERALGARLSQLEQGSRDQRSPDRAAHVPVRAELAGCGDAHEDGQQQEEPTARGRPHSPRARALVHPAEPDRQAEHGAHEPGADQRPQQRLERAGQQVEHPVHHGHGRWGVGEVLSAARLGHDHPDLRRDGGDLVADHDLELPAALHGAHDARQGPNRLAVGQAPVDQHHAQPRRAAADGADVARPADAPHDLLGQRSGVHLSPHHRRCRVCGAGRCAP